MKVTNWRRKLAATLVAGGLMAPSALYATDLNSPLLTDGGFENVSATTCCFGANRLNSWTAGTQPGFAYAVSLYYDNGGPLAGGGDYYFTSNGDNDFNDGATDVDAPGKVSQIHAITAGTGATQIGIGEAAAVLSGFFSSYLDDGDYGHLHVEFLNASNASLGAFEIDGSDDTSTWLQRRGSVFVPVGTTSIKTSVYGTAITGGPDGYIDNVDVRLVPAVEELIFLEVNTTNGQVSIKNQSGDPFHLDYYEIRVPGATQEGDHNGDGSVNAADYVAWRKIDNTQGGYDDFREHFGESGGGSLDPVGWNSLQDPSGNPIGFPSGNGTGNGWEEAGGSSSTVLSESFLLGNSLVANNADIDLGAAFIVGSPQNLEFYYGVVPDNGLGQFEGPGTLVRGFVRYVTSGSGGSGGVPEPSSVLLVGIGLASLAVGGRSSACNRSS